MNKRTANRFLLAILALYLALGVTYSVVNPLFESPDEALNYENIRFLIEERRLPVLKPDKPTKAHHPPLYYVLGALLTHWVPNQHFEAITERVNPFWIHKVGEYSVDNKSLYLHNPTLEHFPYRDVALGVHLVRWLSLLMGLGTVLLIYRTTRELLPDHPSLAVGAAALIAFNPMLLFISSSVHDDPLANLVAAALLYITARTLSQGATTRRAVALGLLTGAAILTKLTCLLILPTVGLALLWRVLSDQKRSGWQETLRLGAVVAMLALLVGGWWLVRNQILYGEPTSMGRQVEAWGGTRENAPDVAAAIRELSFLHDSFWGAFGYGQIPMPHWVDGLTRILSLLTIGGLMLFAARYWRGRAVSKQPPIAWLIVGSAPFVTFLVVFARMTLIDTANFGRYLFVSLGFLAPLYVLGLSTWLPRQAKWERRFVIGLSLAMLALAIFALVGVLFPAYAPPAMLTQKQVASRSRPADLRFDRAIHLIGYDLSQRRANPGGEVAVTLCWEAMSSMEENYAYFVHFLGPEESIVGARNTHPGLSRYPTSRWKPGDRFCDVLEVPVEHWTPAPAVYDVEVGWHKPGSDERLPAFDPEGAPIELAVLDRIKVAPRVYPTVTVPTHVDANLSNQITLLGYRADQLEVTSGETLDIMLYWEARTPPPADYTVFLHLAASQGPPHAQDDGQPRSGRYPTSFWDVGEVVTDSHALQVPVDLPPGDYPLVAGLYRLETGERLRWLAPDGTVKGDAVPLATVVIRSDSP